jgi:GGDEF domain-containing protein
MATPQGRAAAPRRPGAESSPCTPSLAGVIFDARLRINRSVPLTRRLVSPRSTIALLTPGALALLAPAATLGVAGDAEWAAQAARGYPPLLLLGVLVLAWRFQRSRIAAGAVALLVGQLALHPLAAGASEVAVGLSAALLPALFLGLVVTADRGVGTPAGMLQLAAAPLLAVVAVTLLAVEPGWVARLVTAAWIDPWYTRWSPLPQPALAAALAGTIALGATAAVSRRPVEAGLAWSAVAGTLALASPAGSTARGLWFLGAGLALACAFIEASYALAYHDELTGLPGRRSLRQLLARLRGTYTVAVVDVDRFKTFNDIHGHDVGDQVLRMVASRLAAVGGGGRAFRSGGEEFTLVFPGSTRKEALPHAESVRQAVESSEFRVRNRSRPRDDEGTQRRGRVPAAAPRLAVTVSVGLAEHRGEEAAGAVLAAADRAMYRAKKNGRNRVAV